MYHLKLEIPELPASLNKSLRTYRHDRDRSNKKWYELIWLLTRSKRPDLPLKKARIKITRCYYRSLDFDGLVGSLKPVVDGLTRAGVIYDDRWKITGKWEIDQVFRPLKNGPLLIVEVFEIKE